MKMKTTQLFLAVILAFAFRQVSLYAVDVTFDISDGEAAPGGRAEVTISMTSDTGVRGLSVVPDWDPDVITLIEASDDLGLGSPDFMVITPDSPAGFCEFPAWERCEVACVTLPPATAVGLPG